jgi:thiamine transport system ATP-binding protein
VSLDIQVGERIVIVGPSGCGKTSLLRLIAGLDQPDEGEIWLNGRRLAAAARNIVPPHERRVGFVFQDLALWPHLTVQENLDFVVGSASVPRLERPGRTHEMLKLLRLEPLSGRYPHQLSGGEQQRAALARALVGQPRLLLLDEPFSNLDPDLRVVLRGELAKLQRQIDLTTIYVTHDREDAAALADRTIPMRDGRVEAVT